MSIPVGLNVWSRLVEDTFPYLDEVLAPFDSLWIPDHVQYNALKVGEGWTLMSFALGRYPDKTVGHQVLCNSFRNPALLAKMMATAQAISGGRAVLGIGAGLERGGIPLLWLAVPARQRTHRATGRGHQNLPLDVDGDTGQLRGSVLSDQGRLLCARTGPDTAGDGGWLGRAIHPARGGRTG